MEQYDKYMEEGKKYINEDKWQEWINYESMYKDALLGLSVLQRIVEIMRMLDEGKYYEKIRDKMINEWQCEGYNYIRSAVIRFSKHGEEFGEKSKNRYKTKNRYKPRYQILEEINFSIKSLLGKNK